MDKKQSFLLLSAVAIGTLAYQALKPVRSRVDVVDDFELDRYLGKWYEIARFDFFWEKNLKNVTALYEKNEDGSIRVENSGYDYIKHKDKSSIGKAKFTDKPHLGSLKVSFFGPFYSAYNVVMIEDDYQYALVFGENTDCLWILSRNKNIPMAVKEKFLLYASESGYDLENLVWTKQD